MMGQLRRQTVLLLAAGGSIFGIGAAVGIIAFCGLWPQNEPTLAGLFNPVRAHLPATIEVGPEPSGHVDSGPSELAAPAPAPSISPSPTPSQPTPAPQQSAGITVVPPAIYTSPTDDSGGDRHRGSGGH
jgi:hypothetical protein